LCIFDQQVYFDADERQEQISDNRSQFLMWIFY